MNDQIITNTVWLQYGALGLLAMVLGAIFMYLKKSQKFMEDTQKFIQNLAQQAITNRQAEIEAWKQLTKDNIETNTMLLEGLRQLSHQVAENCKQTEQEHQKLLAAINKLAEDD